MRFELVEEYDGLNIHDNEFGEDFFIEYKRNSYTAEALCDLLNDLANENKLLKERL